MANNLLFILTGSIAAYKACDALSQLVQRGHRVRTVATEAALKFVGAATLEGLTGEKVATDLFAPGAALEHITLTRWADAVVVCPATAHTLNRMAAGLGDDLAGALLLAHDWKKPLVIAMNPAMWSHPATVAAVEKLRAWGARFIPVGAGRTACGELGEGRLAEPEQIVAAVEAALARPMKKLRVLITSGGTVEPIDDVRVLTNISTGETGARMARQFAAGGHEVLLLRATGARPAADGVQEETFTTFRELDAALTRLLAAHDFDAVVHVAAVSDFSVDAVEVDGVAQPRDGKLSSDLAPVIRLRRNPKLLDTLRARSRHVGVRIIGFKLTQGASPTDIAEAVTAQLASGVVDFVVHNDLARRAAGAFPADIWDARGAIVARCADRADIAPALEKILTDPNPPELQTLNAKL
jgi:phosphopantothenoylcysteine decarboxylase/phosphopantothenate--cysteine ligase